MKVRHLNKDNKKAHTVAYAIIDNYCIISFAKPNIKHEKFIKKRGFNIATKRVEKAIDNLNYCYPKDIHEEPSDFYSIPEEVRVSINNIVLNESDRINKFYIRTHEGKILSINYNKG